MATGVVHRCATCGAPLENTVGQVFVRCAYCLSENRLIEVAMANAMARSTRMVRAAAAGQRLASELEARGEQLLAAFQRESERVHDDPDAAHAALRHLEGFLRLQYAPTLLVYQSLELDDPMVTSSIAQIDEAIDSAMMAGAAGLGITYRTTRERLNGG